jgi:hypothetical protein
MRITVAVQIDVDPERWDLSAGTGTDDKAIRDDVTSYVLTTLQGAAMFDETLAVVGLADDAPVNELMRHVDAAFQRRQHVVAVVRHGRGDASSHARAECGCGWRGELMPISTVEGWALAERDGERHCTERTT